MLVADEPQDSNLQAQLGDREQHYALLEWCQAVLPVKPNYRLGHPENYLFSLSKKIFNFEKGSTGAKTAL